MYPLQEVELTFPLSEYWSDTGLSDLLLMSSAWKGQIVT